MSDYGENIAKGIVAAIVATFFIGGLFFVGLYFLVSWLLHHVRIEWVS